MVQTCTRKASAEDGVELGRRGFRGEGSKVKRRSSMGELRVIMVQRKSTER